MAQAKHMAKGGPRGTKGNPMGTKGDPREVKGGPKEGQGGPKDPHGSPKGFTETESGKLWSTKWKSRAAPKDNPCRPPPPPPSQAQPPMTPNKHVVSMWDFF